MNNRRFWLCAAALLALVLCTRLPILTHEMLNHPDEHVFVQGATSLRDVLLRGAEYTETKPYPEGSYFFFLPFQLLAWVIGRLTGLAQDARVWNRIASLAYFGVGGLTGLMLLKKHFGGGKSMAVYTALLAFSLFHIEQSRYGTGDAISFALLMLTVYCTAQWTGGGKNVWLYASGVLLGFLGAVKYPLLYFCLAPLCAVFLREKNGRARAKLICAGVLLAAAGFLILSPEVIKDPRYIIDVCRREIKAYMLSGSRVEVGGPLNHAFALAAYWLGYSDLLLAPVFTGIGIRCLRRKGDKAPRDRLLYIALPVIAGGFALYNLFVSALFMRTLYPFFCIALLYTAYGAEKLLESRRAVAALLLGLSIARGVWFIGAYLPGDRADVLDGYIAQAQQIAGTDRITGLVTNRYMTGHWTRFRDRYPQARIVELSELHEGKWPELASGDIVVTGPLEMARAKPYLFPIDDAGVQNCIDGWAAFKEKYAEYYVGQSYPQYYAGLFGFWINGVVSEFDFPMNFVYAVP